MKPFHCAAVDLGATSGRVILGTWARRRLTLREVHRFPNAFHSLGGHDYWDLAGLWAEVRTGLARARDAAGGKLTSVGVCTWGVDYALVDRTGRLVFPVHAYRDTRTAPLVARLRRGAYRRIYALTGLPDYPYNSSLQLQEVLDRFPTLTRLAARCLFLPDYFNFLLSGRMENEISICSHSQLLDVHKDNWSRAALAHFGVPARWFSRPLHSPARLGPVRGLPGFEQVQVIAVPGHDTACAFAAMPADPAGGDLYLSTGTWSLLGCESDRPVLGEEARELKISNERMGDGRYRPLRSCLGLWLLEQTLPAFRTRPHDRAGWRRLIAAATAAPAPRMLLDVSDSALFNPPDMRTAIDAQLLRRESRPPRTLPGYVRLICASLARSHAEGARIFSRLTGRRFRRILMVGGGAKNALLCQATAEATGLPVHALQLEGTAVGNLANQLVGLGAVPSLRAFRADFAQHLTATIYRPHPRS